jgi:hypothetical protein
MRKIISKIGDTRIKSGFLFFPLTLNNERRWWEKAMWKQRYAEVLDHGPLGEVGSTETWVDMEWVDE